jgi:pimeloyl-ACP methyl ester carboxylesterase
MSDVAASAPRDPHLSSPVMSLVRGALRVLSHASPKTASKVAMDLFMTPRRFRTPERERALIAGATPFDVRLGDANTIKAWSWGEGPLVVLVHGWEGRGSQLSAFVPPLVADGYRVVAFDAPGHGASDGNRSSLPHFTYALRGVVDAVAQPVHAIIAHSLGCAATALALKEGLLANRLVFIAPPLEPVDYTRRFGQILNLGDDIIEGLQRRIEERFMRKWSDYSLALTAREMTAPLLIIHDRDDRETYWSEGNALAEAWAGARLISTEALGHRKVLREPALIEEARKFVTG